MVYAPIWKDTNYSSTSSQLHYKLFKGSELVYEGIAYRLPTANTLTININKIAKDYLSQDIDSLLSTTAASQTNLNAYAAFELQRYDGTILETYGFLYDWEKGYSWGGAATTLSLPINGEFISGQMKLRTTVSSSRSVTTYRNTGFYNKEVCGNYVLYYLNARGGWDSFAYTGRCIRTDNITSYSFNHSFDNNTTDFEVGKFFEEIVPTYELHTGILTEEQSKLYAKHLVSTVKAYLHNIEEGTIVPVVITDNSVVYQDGAEDVITYRTMVKESQIQIRQ